MAGKADLEFAAKQLDRILGFFPRVEAKASFLFALNSGMLGILAINIKKEDLVLWQHVLPILVAVLLLSASLYFAYRCTFPSLKGGSASLIYFAEIAKLREANYIESIKSADTEQLTDDFLGQAWRNSEILALKFSAIKNAFALTAAALIPWVIFLVLASVTHANLAVVR